MPQSGPEPAVQSLPTEFAYSPWRRILLAGAVALACMPLAYLLRQMLSVPIELSYAGALLLVILFLLAPPIFLLLRYGHYFRKFYVRTNQLEVSNLGRRWMIQWSFIVRLVRRTQVSLTGRRFYQVKVKLVSPEGQEDWINLFDSGLTEADALYAQVLRHTPHVHVKELEDRAVFPRRWI